MAVNENLYNWMLKTQGMPAAEWYRNNPNKPSESNPHLPKGTYVPKASVDDPQKQRTASAIDPTRDPGTYADSGLASEMPKLASGKYAFASEQELKDMFPGASYKALEIPKYGNIDISQYGIGYKDTGSGSHYLFNKLINSPEFSSLEKEQEALWEQGQNLRKPYSSGKMTSAGLEITDFEGYSKVFKQYENLMRQRQKYATQQVNLAKQYNTAYAGKPLEGWENIGFYADVTAPENDTQIAAEYGAGFPKQPAWMKQIEAEYNKVKNKPYSPGTPKPGRGMGDTWEGPVREASTSSDTDYSIATALSGSDEQRQQQTFQAEYDPQKAQTATAAAKAYKKAAATEDPFRSQAAFG